MKRRRPSHEFREKEDVRAYTCKKMKVRQKEDQSM
jgi:hypothetical protein